MKGPSNAVLSALLLGLLNVAAATSTAGQRWDLGMLEDASVWTKLLTEYGNAQHEEAWNQRKAALQELVKSHPESRWADDAALILACGKASFEGDASGAIRGLEAVIEQYPHARTVVEQWAPDIGCRFDETWLMWAGGLAMPGPEGSLITTRPFGAHGEIVHVEKEALAYFDQLEACPRSTKVMARLMISRIHAHAGDLDSAASVLEGIVDESFAYLGIVSAADRHAASRDDGYYVRTLVNRPEHRAFLMLIDHLQRQGETDRAGELSSRWVELCSPDGWLWSIHRHLGDSFAQVGLRDKAREHYALALAGLDLYQRDMERRRRFVTGSDIPEDFWDVTRADLNQKLKG